jgi:fatty-acyl-CoA synthase
MPLSYDHGTCEEKLIGQTIGDNLRSTVQRHGARDALVVLHQGYRASYAELWAQCDACAKGLLALGVGKSERVGIWAPNRYEWVVVQYATARIGAVLVNINPAYRASELEYVLNQSGIGTLVLARGFRGADYVQMLEAVRPRCPVLKQAIVIEDGWDTLLQSGESVSDEALHAVERTLQFDEPINIQYTSGTTGMPKGATLSHHNILNNAWFSGRNCGYAEHDRVCIPVPFYHCFGMVLGNLACTARGACMVVPAESFDPAATLAAVARERCTSLYGVPTMFIAELEHPDFASFDLSSLRTGIMAGSPCPVEVMKKVTTLMNMREVTIGYGMTELSPLSTQSCAEDSFELRVATVGRAHPHQEICIVDPASGAVVPRGAAGEFCARGYSVMLGYWNNPEATAKAIDTGGWMHTGDLATMDEAGHVRIVGRIKDMIIRGGENIFPREIEEFLYTHPAVSDAQVIGVPSAKYGEEVMAWIKLREGSAIDGEGLAQWCKGQIAGYKIPRHWKLVDGFPMTVTGKVQKFRMREIAVAELGLGDAAAVKTA